MDKFREEVKKDLIDLTNKGKILFGALTCEKLYPNYVFFYKSTGWGNPDVLIEGLALIYQYLIKDDLFSVKEIEDLITNIDVVTPDTEDFPGIATSFALDSCTSVYSVLSYLIDNNIEYIVDVATYARDTVDMFIQEKYDLKSSDPDIELTIANDSLMIEEKKRQKELLNKLKTLDTTSITDQMIESLRDRRPIIELDILT